MLSNNFYLLISLWYDMHSHSMNLVWQNRMTYYAFFSRYVAPEYASTGMLNERSDVYSFGILLMEIISGRNPVDYSRPPGEVCIQQINLMTSYSQFNINFFRFLPLDTC